METRKQYFGSQMLKSGTTAATLSLTALIMVLSVAILVPEPSLGLERGDRRLHSPELTKDLPGSSHPHFSPERQAATETIAASGMPRSLGTLARNRAGLRDLRSELRLDLIEIEKDT